MTHLKREYLIAGNWKMFKTVEESIQFVNALHGKVAGVDPAKREGVDILVFPPFTSLYAVKDLSGIIKTGSQNLHFEENGAFTGEVSPSMLKNIVDYVLIGHSERREIFNELDRDLNKKVKTALKFGFTPVLCIGESLEERERGETFSKVARQLELDLDGLETPDILKIVIAYEPIWAIGTGRVATPEQAQEVHAFIREVLKKKITDDAAADSVKILYGGSVKPKNSFELLTQKDINGVLVGGASLQVDDFFAIIVNSFELANG
jgi:triosephosphate isomerase